MKRKIIFGLLFFAVILACYFIEQYTLQSFRGTYGSYKQEQNITTKAAMETISTNALNLGVLKENQKAKDKKESESNDRNQEDIEVSDEKELDIQDEASDCKIAFLTFDDGPSEVTPKILKTLEKYDVKATFFLIGDEITAEREETLRSMVEQGHCIGVHTYSHNQNKIYSSKKAYIEDFDLAYSRIVEVTGYKPTIFRFPYGSANPYMSSIKTAIIKAQEERGFTYYDWNLSAEDSIGKPTEYSIKKNIFKKIDKYDLPVILMHDSNINNLTAKVLPVIIEELKARGYEFGTLDHRDEACQFPKEWGTKK